MYKFVKYMPFYKIYERYVCIQQFLAFQIQFSFDICQIDTLIGDDFGGWHKIVVKKVANRKRRRESGPIYFV